MKRLFTVLFAALSALSVLTPARAEDLGPFCDPKNFPSPISGQGTRSQLSIFYNLWLPSYTARCAAATGTVRYFGTSDPLAAHAMLTRNGQFFARDVPLTASDQVLIENDLDQSGLRNRQSEVQHVPMFLNALAVTYNLNCGTNALKLRGEVLAAMYTGAISRWNDNLLVRDNAWLANCNKTIKLAVRSDESGTSTVFKDYLAKRLPAFAPFTQPQLNRTWPASTNVACKGEGDAGVAGCVASRVGAIGYVGLKVANEQGLSQALVDNAANAFSKASLSGCSVAADAATVQTSARDDWNNGTLTNPASGYALCSYSFMLLWDGYGRAYGRINTNPQEVRNVRDFFNVILSSEVHSKLTTYGVGTLPARILALSRQAISVLTYDN